MGDVKNLLNIALSIIGEKLNNLGFIKKKNHFVKIIDKDL